MADQVDCTHPEPLDEADHVGDVLGDTKIIAFTVPMLRKIVPQTWHDHTRMRRQKTNDRGPDAKVAERSVHANEGYPASHIEISHVVAIDAELPHDR